jgi:hypothetical protein
MALYKDQTLSGDLTLDGNRFENIHFARARLIYAGGPPPELRNVSFLETSIDFQGPANATVVFLRSLAQPNSPLRQVAQGLLPELADTPDAQP